MKKWIMLKRSLLVAGVALLLTVATFVPWQAQRVFASTATITVNTATTHQTIAGLGGNYPRPGWGAGITLVGADQALGDFTTNNLEAGYARVALPLDAWEPSNGTYVDSGNVHDTFLLMQQLANKGMHLVGTIFNEPNWLTGQSCSTPCSDTVPSANWSAAATGLAQFLTTAHNTYGVTVAYLSFNEPDGGGAYNWSAANLGNYIAEQGGPQVAALGYGTKWLAGDTTSPSALYTYASTILQNSSALPYIGALSYHQYGSPDTSALSNVVNLANTYSLPVMCMEIGADASAWQENPSPFPTWDYAFSLAQDYYANLTYGQTTAVNYWEYQDGYSFQVAGTNANGSLTPYPAFYAIKQLTDNLQPGSQVVSTSSSASTLLPLAAQQGSNFMVQVINTNSSSMAVTFNGLPNVPLNLELTSASANEQVSGTYTPSAGSLTLTLPAQSINTLTTRSPQAIQYNRAPANLALGATPSASSTTNQYGWNLAEVNDGFRYSTSSDLGWTSSTSNAGSNHTEWVQLNLGTSQQINEVILYPRDDSGNAGGGFPLDFTIQVSSDGSNWTTVVSKTSYPNPGGNPQTFTFPAMNAQYMRVTGTNLPSDSQGHYFMTLAEIEAYDVNWAFGTTIPSASSTTNQYGWNLVDVNDGVRDSISGDLGWTSSTSNAGSNHTEWVQLQCSENQQISEVILYPRDDSGNAGGGFPLDFTIQVSSDGSNWTTVISKTSYPNPGGTPQPFTFSATSAQYVRVTGTNLSPDSLGHYFMTFAEIEAY